jgi:hypothetical protein
MICTLTARRLKAGSYDDFRVAWGRQMEASAEEAKRWNPVYHCRDVEDPNVVVSFGLFDGTREELRDVQDKVGRNEQVSSIEPHVEEVLLDGAYEVVEELTS